MYITSRILTNSLVYTIQIHTQYSSWCIYFYILHTGCAINLARPAIIMYRSDKACGAPPRTYNYCVARCTKKFDKICILSTFLGKLAKKRIDLKGTVKLENYHWFFQTWWSPFSLAVHIQCWKQIIIGVTVDIIGPIGMILVCITRIKETNRNIFFKYIHLAWHSLHVMSMLIRNYTRLINWSCWKNLKNN